MACSEGRGGAPGLFVYGTLQIPEILALLTGRAWPGAQAELCGYCRYRVQDQAYPAIIEQPGSSVSGVLYAAVDAAALELLDHYEGELYERRLVTVRGPDGLCPAYVYVLRAGHRARLGNEGWDLEAFKREHLASYLDDVALTRRAPLIKG